MTRFIYTTKTLVKTGITRYFRDRTALFFTIAFPLIFLFIFGGLFGKSNDVSFKVALINESQSQFSRELSDELGKNKLFKINHTITQINSAKERMNRGELDGIIMLPPGFGEIGPNHYPAGTAQLFYNESNQASAQALRSVLDGLFQDINTPLVRYEPPFKVEAKSTNDRGLTSFDYIFSGMLGFAIIGLGIFGPTNAFPEMKKQGILRRLRTTPISTAQFVISNVLSYVVIGLISMSALLAVGLSVFHLNMRGSYLTLVALLIIGIITIFGFGMAVGGWAKNEQQAAPLSNIVAFPMMFLSGTFFPTYLMPEWLQQVARYLPLTPINDSIRLIITENRSLLQLGPQLALIGAWMVAIYVIAFRLFRWE
jgi:ABC-2 type transport system permease protein